MHERTMRWVECGLMLLAASIAFTWADNAADADGSDGPDDENARSTLVEQVNVTASRYPKKTEKTTESVSAVTSSDIAAMAPFSRNLAALLTLVPGVQTGLGTSPLEAGIAVRGLGDDRSPVLVDGEPQNVAQGEIREDLFSVDPFDIETIEVLRGSASGTYGSAATGGLVNVITREPRADSPLRVDARTGGSSFGGGDVRARVSAGTDRLAGSVSVGAHRESDYTSGRGETVPNGQHARDARVTLRLFAGPNDEVSLRYGGYRYRSDLLAISEVPETFLQLPRVAKDRASLTWERRAMFGGTTTGALRLYGGRLDQRFVQEAWNDSHTIEVFRNESAIGVTSAGAGLQFSTALGRAMLTWGAEYARERGTNDVVTSSLRYTETADAIVPDARQTSLSAYVGLDLPLSARLSISAGGRYDRFETVADPVAPTVFDADGFEGRDLREGDFSPKLGIVYAISPAWSLRANYAKGFRVPTVKERFFQGLAGPLNAELEDIMIGGIEGPTSIILRGNPDLTPERSYTYELGSRHAVGDGMVDVTVYRMKATGLLTAVRVGQTPKPGFVNQIFQFFNRSEADIRGVELQASLRLLPRVSLHAAGTWTRAIEETTGERLPSISPAFGTLQLRYAVPHGASLIAQVRATRGRERLAGFTTVDLGARVPIAPYAALTAGVTNVSDVAYREAQLDFYAPGRRFVLGLELNLSM